MFPFVSLLFAPLALACTPNFSGRAVSVVDPTVNLEWQPSIVATNQFVKNGVPNAVGDWRFEFTGDADGSYWIKLDGVPANDLFLAQGFRSNFVVLTNGGSSPLSPQPAKWGVTCDWCAGGDATSFSGTYASDCQIDKLATNSCAARKQGETDSPVSFLGCDLPPQNSTWDFVFP
ncbi:hypothetical protein DL96DRAFT_1818956 [Flagelloscypha sp. PMI_526]|nr:hypothetical protein DL96DRAFT_1818956 [Flagelloscypha sp. PMI_526]